MALLLSEKQYAAAHYVGRDLFKVFEKADKNRNHLEKLDLIDKDEKTRLHLLKEFMQDYKSGKLGSDLDRNIYYSLINLE